MTDEQLNVALDAIPLKEPTDTGEVGLDGNLHFSTLDELKFWRETNV